MSTTDTGWPRAAQEVRELSDEIDRVVNQVKTAILKVEESSGDQSESLSIKNAELTLRAVRVHTGGGKFEFKLFGLGVELGAEISKSETQTMTLKLKPADAAEAFTDEDVPATLATALLAIRDSVSHAAAVEPKFDMEEATVELNFEVTKDGHIEVVAVGKASRTNVQTAKLTLGPPGA